ncbi:hypothetical protein AVEN_123453-1 [Araneus ventricosus]|uniref:Prokineticin domain-containing protein n=1 Tax=Araneus ventricosus TaxID=182803 RepID=A0A4Y2T121_ARAVE|nr:hypothetical protein AVEN_123453-1 [Araneus ventricosus]
MKTAILVALALCAVLAVCESKKCHKQEDCEADECCVQVLSIADPTCKKLRQKGDHCLTDLTINDGNYAFGCPCVKGLKCGPHKVFDHNGVSHTLLYTRKCVPV